MECPIVRLISLLGFLALVWLAACEKDPLFSLSLNELLFFYKSWRPLIEPCGTSFCVKGVLFHEKNSVEWSFRVRLVIELVKMSKPWVYYDLIVF